MIACSFPRVSAAVLLAGSLSFLLGPLLTAQEKKDDKKPAQRIEKKTYEFKDAGKDTEYALFVPSGYDKSKKTPLVIALHGLYGSPQQFIRTRGLVDEAEKRGFIVAAPMGYNNKGWYGSRGTKGGGKGDPENLGELSEKDVMNVLDLVKKGYTVDSERIYLMGHSMGGGGTWHLALKYPDVWAGLAPIAPAIFRQPTELEKIKNTPVILVQGDKDSLVPVAGARRWAEQMKKLEMTYDYVEVAGGDHGNVVAANMPKIFEFFEKNKKKAAAK